MRLSYIRGEAVTTKTTKKMALYNKEVWKENGSKPAFDARNERNDLLMKQASICMHCNYTDNFLAWLRGLQNIHLLCCAYTTEKDRNLLQEMLNDCDKKLSLLADKRNRYPPGSVRKLLLDTNQAIMIIYKDHFTLSKVEETELDEDDLI